MVVFAAVVAACVVSAQSIAQDSAGGGVLTLPTTSPLSAGLFTVNSADNSVTLTYVNRRSPEDTFYGFSIKAKATNSIAQVIKAGEFRPGAKFDFTWGRHSLRTAAPTPTPADLIPASPDSADFDWIALRLGVEASRLALLHRGRPFAEQVERFTLPASRPRSRTTTSGAAAFSGGWHSAWSARITMGASRRRGNRGCHRGDLQRDHEDGDPEGVREGRCRVRREPGHTSARRSVLAARKRR